MIEALPSAARRVAEVCPTGAFALKGVGTCAPHGSRPVLHADGRAVTIIPLRPTS